METVSLETISEAGVSNSNECQLNLELSDEQKNRSRKKKRKWRKKENGLKSSDSHINNQNGKADEAASFEERKEGQTEKTTREGQVQLPGNCLSTLPIEPCQRASVSREAEGSKLTSTEEKYVASVVITGCLKSEVDTVEQQNGVDVKANDTVSQTQNPKAKKKKRRKTKTMEVCDPLGNTLATSVKSGSVECMETAGVGDVRSKKRKGKKKKTSSTDQKTADTEVCDPSGNTLLATIKSGSVECLLDHSNKEVLENCDWNAGQEIVGEDGTSKTETSAPGEILGVQNPGTRKEKTKDEIVESNQDALGAEGISDVGRKSQKRKKHKSVATRDSDSVECLLYHSNRGVENCDGIADEETAGKDLASKIEESATEGKSVQNVENTKKRKKDKNREVDQDASGAEGDDKVQVKTKKRKSKKKKKSCEDHKIDNMDEKKDDVSVPKNDEEVEFDGEKLDTYLSSSVLILNNVAQGVAQLETGRLPRCSCEGQTTRKLVAFDLNGILADIVQGYTGRFVPDGKISSRSVFRRPFVASFLDFCFERFNVGIWSSRRIGLDYMINIVMGNHARKLLFCFDQSVCITTNFKTLENSIKPLFLKDLRRVWNSFGTCLTCGKRKYDETNTLLVDDSPDKALCNPPHTGIFPFPYQYTDRKDSALGPEGELRKYLERLVDAENVQKFVEENPIGQTAITETHISWNFYSKVIKEHNIRKSIQGIF